MKQKYLAVALSAIFAATALAGCGSDSDSNYDYPATPTPTPETPTPTPETPTPTPETPTPTPTPETPTPTPTPETPTPTPTPTPEDTTDNPGDAATDPVLDEKATVGGQQYIRTPNAKFDEAYNNVADNNANNTVRNSVTIQNEKLNNIVLGRETIERKEGNEAILRYAGETINGLLSDKTADQTFDLQDYNGTGSKDGNVLIKSKTLYNVVETFTTNADNALPYFNDAGEQIKNENEEPLFVKTTQEDTGTRYLDESGKAYSYTNDDGKVLPIYIVRNNVTTNDPILASNVLVTATPDAEGVYKSDNGLVRIKADVSNKEAPFAFDGLEDDSKSGTRIFGNNYLNTTNTGVNSHQFVGQQKAEGVNALNIAGLDDKKAFTNIKLDNVQYGRVTSNIDKLSDGVIKAGGDNAKYFESEIVAKGTDGSVDTYFYRGTGETSIEKMSALREAGGTFEYNGHALMYGIDNSYHGDLGDPNSNSFGGTDIPLQGKGNFVKAQVDMGARSVEGNVFNVWQVTAKDGKAAYRQDNVVDFGGQIFGNSIKGEAQLTYDKDNKGSFKGSFFGDNAEELGGAFNSVNTESGYGTANWGGVFGAQRAPEVKPETPKDPDGNANQTEDQPKP